MDLKDCFLGGEGDGPIGPIVMVPWSSEDERNRFAIVFIRT